MEDREHHTAIMWQTIVMNSSYTSSFEIVQLDSINWHTAVIIVVIILLWACSNPYGLSSPLWRCGLGTPEFGAFLLKSREAFVLLEF